MSTNHRIATDERLSSPSRRRKNLVDDKLLQFLESSLESIKAEIAAGTYVDPQLVADMERRIEQLKSGTLS